MQDKELKDVVFELSQGVDHWERSGNSCSCWLYASEHLFKQCKLVLENSKRHRLGDYHDQQARKEQYWLCWTQEYRLHMLLKRTLTITPLRSTSKAGQPATRPLWRGIQIRLHHSGVIRKDIQDNQRMPIETSNWIRLIRVISRIEWNRS